MEAKQTKLIDYNRVSPRRTVGTALLSPPTWNSDFFTVAELQAGEAEQGRL